MYSKRASLVSWFAFCYFSALFSRLGLGEFVRSPRSHEPRIHLASLQVCLDQSTSLVRGSYVRGLGMTTAREETVAAPEKVSINAALGSVIIRTGEYLFIERRAKNGTDDQYYWKVPALFQ